MVESIMFDSSSSLAGLKPRDPLQAEAFFKADRINGLMSDLTEVAAMAYGSGVGEGVNGGKGHIGMLNGKVIKFNTKSSERANLEKSGAMFDEMKAASDTLRNRLATAVDAAVSIVSSKTHGFNNGQNQNLAEFKARAARLLGVALTQEGDAAACDLEKTGEKRNMRDLLIHYRMLEGRGLLTRAVAAQTVTLIRDFLRQHAPDQATLMKNRESLDPVSIDLNVWRKVKDMRNLKSQDVRGDANFDYFKEASLAARRVEAIKCSNVGFPDFAAKLREIGNAEMCSRFVDVLIDQGSERNQTTLTFGNNKPISMVPEFAEGALRGYRAQSLAASMDKMFAGMKNLYLNRQPRTPQAVRDLGESPFMKIFEEAIGEIKGRDGKGYDVADAHWSLSENETRNLLALMRNKALAFVVAQDNELVRNAETGKTTISEETMLVKDLFLSCARLFDRDADHCESSKQVERHELNRKLDDGTNRMFFEKQLGLRYFTPPHWNVFTLDTYGYDPVVANEILASEHKAEQQKKAVNSVVNDLEAFSKKVSATNGSEADLVLVKPHFHDLASGLVKKFAEKLANVNRTDVAELEDLRKKFVLGLANCVPNVTMDNREFKMVENGTEKSCTFQELRLKEIANFFDTKLVPQFAKGPKEA